MSTHTIGDQQLQVIHAAFTGTLVQPEDPGFDDARAIWNGMVDKYPLLIARCADVDDVVTAVNFARENDLPVAIRGGGHNVAGSAICDDGLVIDLSEMTNVVVDTETRRASVQGGATIGDVDRATQRHGLATALGVVSETGIAGLTLNGGLGHLRRKYGLSLDNLTSVEIVTADGVVRTASDEENTDLFWAIRGGGGNFGVVTNFEYKLHEVGPDVNMLFTWYGGDDVEDALRAFREYTTAASRDGSVVAFYAFVPEDETFPEESWGDPAIAMIGCYDGPTDEAEAEFRELRTVAEPIADMSGPIEYTALQTLLDEDYPDGLRYYWKAVYVEELTDDIVDLVVRYGADSPSHLSTVDVWHLGGAIGDVEPDATAFWHRTNDYMLTFEANWEDPAVDDENVAWVRNGIEELREMLVTTGGYGNFPGFGEDPSQTLFGDNYNRLVDVKTVYDPENLFKLNTNIEPHEQPSE
ncbi:MULTISPECIES: FAD-binding oxidoreductase [Haloferax]|uniref:FAD-binding protein n=2 Tax=Haloferax TaxID=2251 RepID=A0A6G1Z307_9EURY|nr:MULTISPECIES: FAD-binding oxidoreductase [Haloferax]KAB1188014.1 FAD-binding oxidoreductase [Haloferax sp. CBA1149]MRW80684.1 FAD-binding protein [Haloferax marinisediminis]